MKPIRYAVILMFLACLSSHALAQVPPVISYQGVLTDAGGAVAADGMYSMTFALYDVPGGGTPLWSEIQSVTVAKGIFNAVLGSVTPISLDFADGYWLGISVAGETELSPRIPLSAAAYSFSSMGVYGSSNVFPSSGNVGIGTATPGYPLHIVTDQSVPLQITSSDGSWAGLYVNASGTGNPMYGYQRGGLLRGYTWLNSSHAWNLTLGGGTRIRAHEDGKVTIGDIFPRARLTVDGGITLGFEDLEVPGTLRWTGADFEGWDGGSWRSLTAAGGGGLPAGTTGQTLWYNGASWAATSSLYNNSAQIGIGTVDPEARLDIVGAAEQKIKVETTSATGAAVLGLESTAGPDDDLDLAKFGPSAAGTIAGVPLANLSLIASGLDSGPMMIGTRGSSDLHFIAGGNRYLRMNDSGIISLFPNSAGPFVSQWYPDGLGGHFKLYDENGDESITLHTDSPDGGRVDIFRDGSNAGIILAGDHNGTNNPGVYLFGATRSAVFDMFEEGDGSVDLPVGAISSAEIFDEPGVTSYTAFSGVDIGTDPTVTVIGSTTISVPAAGYVLVMGTAQIYTNHTNGTVSSCQVGTSDAPTELYSQGGYYIVSENAPSGIYSAPTTVHGLHVVMEAGDITYYLVGREQSGTFTAYRIQLTALYIPTNYGTVNPILAGSDGDALPDEAGLGLTSSDIAARRVASIEANSARIERELAAMREEMESLKAELRQR